MELSLLKGSTSAERTKMPKARWMLDRRRFKLFSDEHLKIFDAIFLMGAFFTEWDKNLDLCSKKCKVKLSICWKNNRQFKANTLAPCFLIQWMICLKRVNGLSKHENSDQLQIWFKSNLCPAVFHCREALFTKLPTIAPKKQLSTFVYYLTQNNIQIILF